VADFGRKWPTFLAGLAWVGFGYAIFFEPAIFGPMSWNGPKCPLFQTEYQ